MDKEPTIANKAPPDDFDYQDATSTYTEWAEGDDPTYDELAAEGSVTDG